MKKFLIYMLAVFFAACSTVGDDTTSEVPDTGGGDVTPQPEPEPPTDKTGIWISVDDVHSVDLNGSKYDVFNKGTYVLEITISEEDVEAARVARMLKAIEDGDVDGDEEDVTPEEVTYEWTGSRPAYVILTPSEDTKSVSLFVNGPNNDTDVDYTITAKGSDDTEYTINLNAKRSKVDSSRTLNGKTLSLRVIDNFNNAMISTNESDNSGIWLAGWSTQGLKRGYWSKDAVVFSDSGRGYVDLRTRKGKSTDEGYNASIGGWQINNRNFSSTGKTDWVAGALHRRGVQRQGYFEARMKFNKKSNAHWDAFWAYEQRVGDSWLNLGETANATLILYEYDMMEYTGTGSEFDQTTHWWNMNTYARVIDPSKTQKSSISGASDLSEWFVLGLYWDKDEVIYYVNGVETIRLKGDAGDGQYSSGSHGTLSASDLTALEAVKDTMNLEELDYKLGVNQFAGMNFKFSTELGINYGGDAITTFESALQSTLGDEGYDSFIIDYYAEYDIQ